MQNTVLRAVKAALQGAGFVRQRSVFYTPHATFIPTGVVFPAIGVKDGRFTESEGPSETVNDRFTIELFFFVDMTADGEEAVVGDDGIMPLVTSVKNLLRANRLGVDAVDTARIVSGTASQLYRISNNRWIVKKSINVQYELEYDR